MIKTIKFYLFISCKIPIIILAMLSIFPLVPFAQFRAVQKLIFRIFYYTDRFIEWGGKDEK